MKSANIGSIIKDLGPKKRSLGYVKCVDRKTNMMQVLWPKTGKTTWCSRVNYGQYVIID